MNLILTPQTPERQQLLIAQSGELMVGKVH